MPHTHITLSCFIERLQITCNFQKLKPSYPRYAVIVFSIERLAYNWCVQNMQPFIALGWKNMRILGDLGHYGHNIMGRHCFATGLSLLGALLYV
jgi:hypothetical protein